MHCTTGDPGYLTTAVNWIGNPSAAYAVVSRGAYVDLFYSGTLVDYFLRKSINPSTFSAVQTQILNTLTGSTFAGAGTTRSGLAASDLYTAAVYDTGSWHYENDGIDQGPMINPGTTVASIADEGTNGLDDNSDGVVDDLGELEGAAAVF